MNYDLSVLAAITRLEHPNTQKIVSATGISERKVQNVIKSLSSDFGISIIRKKMGRSSYFVIKSWGVFESGDVLRQKLDTIELKKDKPLSKQPKSPLLITFSEKHRHFEKVKAHHFKESMRLEGYSINIEDYPLEKSARMLLKEKLIRKYSQYKDTHKVYG